MTSVQIRPLGFVLLVVMSSSLASGRQNVGGPLLGMTNEARTSAASPTPSEAADAGVGSIDTDAIDVSKTLELKALVAEALERNPEIKSMQRNFDRLRERVPQARALPDPMLEVGYLGNILPFDVQNGDPSSARMIGIKQEIPYPGKLALKGRIASMEAESSWWEAAQTARNVVAEVKDAYFELWFLTKAIAIVEKNRMLLEQLTKIAEARYAVGKGIQQDVLKAQVEVSKLVEQRSLLEQRKQSAEARINSLLFRDIEMPLGTPEEVAPQPLTITLDALDQMALAKSPTLEMQRRAIDREEFGLQLAEKEAYPDFTVAFQYQNRPGLPEMYGVTVGVTLPIFFGQKQRPAIGEAAAGAAMERKRFDNARTILLFRIKDGYLAATTAEKLINLYGKAILPQSTSSLESAVSGYEVGSVDFLTLLDNVVTLLNYEMGYYEQISQMERAVAGLEPLVGIPLRP